VLLFNLGGPETLQDVRPFLFNLFSDPDIIRIKSAAVRKTLAWLIAVGRQSKSRGLYRQIGGGSPLRKITEAQAEALRIHLERLGISAGVYVGMRCWKPTIDEALDLLREDAIGRLVALPLFPQYSVTTTGSCFNYFRYRIEKSGLQDRLAVTYVDQWYEEPLYVESVADLIRDTLRKFSSEDPREIRLLYSAHSIPARYLEEGDPYLEQTRRTVELINARLGNAFESTLAFQSKVGPVKWLEPATNEVLKGFGRSGVRRVLAVPISFVSDHIETLQEIDILYKELAEREGIREFHRAESLNLYPKFIEALGNIVRAALETFNPSNVPPPRL
jgi:ferrochelatase